MFSHPCVSREIKGLGIMDKLVWIHEQIESEETRRELNILIANIDDKFDAYFEDC